MESRFTVYAVYTSDCERDIIGKGNEKPKGNSENERKGKFIR